MGQTVQSQVESTHAGGRGRLIGFLVLGSALLPWLFGLETFSGHGTDGTIIILDFPFGRYSHVFTSTGLNQGLGLPPVVGVRCHNTPCPGC